MPKTILVVDGNSLLHANHHATVLTVGDMQVQAIFGMLKSMQKLMNATPGEKEVLVLWDGKAQFRLEICPEYKGNRVAADAKQEASRAALKRQAPFVEKSLSLLGIKQLRSPYLEADDLAGYLVPRLAAGDNYVQLVSGDRDWLQLVSPKVGWFDPIRDRNVNAANFFESTGYETTDAFIHGKALMGDSSDNIPGVGGIGEIGAPVFLAKYKTVDAFFERFDAGELKKLGVAHTRLASPEGRELFRRNVKLMDWRHSRQPEPGEIQINSSVADVDAFEQFCQRLAFQSILREFAVFLKAFGLEGTKELA